MLTRAVSFFLLLASGWAGSALAQTASDTCSRPEVEKRERAGVWEPGPGGVQIPLWPEGVAIQAPETEGNPEWIGNGSPLVAGRYWNWATYVSRPTMTIYPPKGQNTGAAMLVLPGGGYAAVAMDLEGTEICDWITEHGVTCVVLKYRTPQAWRRGKNGVRQAPKDLLPLEDAQRAMALLRHGAATYGIDPGKIGAIGFSAGGHLAAELSNAKALTYEATDAADRQSSPPDFAILLYPGRLWDTNRPKQVMDLAPWIEVSGKAPPTLMIHAMNDPVDDVRHSMAYALALNDAGVPVDMRLYAGGCHAFGLRPTSDPVTTDWPGQVVKWLQDLGIL